MCTFFQTLLRVNGRVVFALIAMVFMAANARALDLMGNQAHHNLVPYMEYLEDSTRAETPFSVISKARESSWKAFDEQIVNFGYTQSSFWLRITLDTSYTRYKHWNLILDNPLLSVVNVYQMQNGIPKTITRTGSSRPYYRRQVNHRGYIVPLDIYEPTEILIMVEAETGLSTGVNIWAGETYWPHLLKIDQITFLFYGITLFLIFYNLINFFFVRDFGYIYYVVYVALFTVYAAGMDGIIFQYIWPDNRAFNPHFLQFISLAILIFAILFGRHFLQINRASNPAVNTLLWAYIGVTLLSVGVILFVNFVVASLLILSLSVMASILAVILSILAINKGFRPAYAYFAATAGLLLALLLFTAYKIGLISSYPMSYLALKVAIVYEGIILSVALVQRLKLLRIDDEEQQSRVMAQRKFFSHLSHEIRNPLYGIIGMIELLKQTRLDTDQSKYLETLTISSSALLDIVNEVLEHAKVESGHISLEYKFVPFADFVSRSVSIVSPGAEAKNLQFSYDIADDIPENVRIDPIRVRQVLINLLGNAVKYTEAGSVHLKICAIQRNHLRFEVSDTGIGISRNEQKRLFESFTRSKNDDSGVGLGLAICKQLIELMSGRIGVQSELAQGSTFWFEIPVNFDSVDVSETIVKPMVKILLVEPSRVDQDVFRAMLDKLGYGVTLSPRAESALDQLILERYDLILIADELPDKNAVDTAKLIRRQELQDGREPVPIICISATATPEFRQEYIQAGMNELLSKPIKLKTLSDIIQKVLEAD
ncbi:7TM diverse intracellular signaling domain-containing protein [Gynuella sunshinyii]|uniref:histidine kinase n=1 Tax=Gynuella sunshinyii YC6258 TaxID=1445510 RepID=A0A0C5VFJ0_9GAMM|nr:7TM diverse intracellular signaling domain-containing protein [Gynuella sunshinyii]AJQ92946.1 signal transduction histidine kinase [Gynuella sunshinyii YC6258]